MDGVAILDISQINSFHNTPGRAGCGAVVSSGSDDDVEVDVDALGLSSPVHSFSCAGLISPRRNPMLAPHGQSTPSHKPLHAKPFLNAPARCEPSPVAYVVDENGGLQEGSLPTAAENCISDNDVDMASEKPNAEMFPIVKECSQDGSSQKESNNNIFKLGSRQSSKTESDGEPDLASQISQLQSMVSEMKSGFTGAMEALAQIQYGDQVLQEKVDSNKTDYEHQLTDIVHMVLSLKMEFGGMLGQLKVATETQVQLQQQVDWLQCERDILLEELERAGVISQQLREKYHSGRDRPNGLNKSGDAPSLSVLLDRAHSAFHGNNHHNNSHLTTSDHDSGVNACHQGDLSSCGEGASPTINPLVQSYIEGLQNQNNSRNLNDVEEVYHVDTELAATINKSLDLSRSLGDKCAEITQLDSSDDEAEDMEDEAAEDSDEAKTEIAVDEGKEVEEEELTPSQSVSQVLSSPDSLLDKPLDTSSVYVTRVDTPKKLPPHEQNAREVQRMRVARELMESERKYCTAIWTVLDHFAAPLQETGIMTSKEVSLLFPACLQQLYDQHCTFLHKLEERLSNWKWHTVIGDILTRFFDSPQCEVFQLYQSYVRDFPQTLNHIRKSCKQNTRFRKYLRDRQRDPSCQGLDIGAFLLTPIQRVPRYVLLIKQMLKYTDCEHPDYYHLETTLEHLGDFLNALNDSIEYSMQVVTRDITPKPKRKLRIGSFRSSSASSWDGFHNPQSKDSGIQSDSKEDQANSSKLFNLSFLRDSFRRKRSFNVNNSYTPSHNTTISHPVSSQPLNHSIVTPAPNDFSQSLLLPPSTFSPPHPTPQRSGLAQSFARTSSHQPVSSVGSAVPSFVHSPGVLSKGFNLSGHQCTPPGAARLGGRQCTPSSGSRPVSSTPSQSNGTPGQYASRAAGLSPYNTAPSIPTQFNLGSGGGGLATNCDKSYLRSKSPHDASLSGSSDNKSLPFMRSERRRRPRNRRPKSSGAELHSKNQLSEALRNLDMNRTYLLPPGHVDTEVEEKRVRRQRPLSMLDPHSPQAAAVQHWPTVPSQESLLTSTDTVMSNTDTLKSSLYSTLPHQSSNSCFDSSDHLSMPPPSSSNVLRSNLSMVKSLPDVSNSDPNTIKHHLTVPRITTQSYGIFGDDDDDASMEESSYQPSMYMNGSLGPTNRSQTFGVPRCKSQNNLTPDGSHSPSQEDIALALARSLMDEGLNDSTAAAGKGTQLPRAGWRGGQSPYSAQQNGHRAASAATPAARDSGLLLPVSRKLPYRPHSAKPRHIILNDTPLKAKPIRREDVWTDDQPTSPTSYHQQYASHNNSATNTSILSTTSNSDTRKDDKKKKKDRGKKVSENLGGEYSDTSKDKKKSSFKDSLKNIFFRKRKHDNSMVETTPSTSKIIEIGSAVAVLETQHDTVSPGRTPREQAAPADKQVIRRLANPEFEEYEDENGDPCSAV